MAEFVDSTWHVNPYLDREEFIDVLRPIVAAQVIAQLLLRSFDPVGPGDTVRGPDFVLLSGFALGFPALARVMLYMRMPGRQARTRSIMSLLRNTLIEALEIFRSLIEGHPLDHTASHSRR
jgi:hypothetical protein